MQPPHYRKHVQAGGKPSKIALQLTPLSHTLMLSRFRYWEYNIWRPKPLVVFTHASGIHPACHPWDSHPPPLYLPNPLPVPTHVWKELKQEKSCSLWNYFWVPIFWCRDSQRPPIMHNIHKSEKKNYSQTRIYTCKRAFGLLCCSSMQYLKRREVHLHLPHGNMAELWKRVLNLLASNPIMTRFPCPKKMNPEGQWIWTTCLYVIRSKSWCTILFP